MGAHVFKEYFLKKIQKHLSGLQLNPRQTFLLLLLVHGEGIGNCLFQTIGETEMTCGGMGRQES